MSIPPDILIPEVRIRDRVSELGRQLSSDYSSGRPTVLVGVMRGALYFLADLSRTVTVPIEIDFLSVSSYSGTKSSGKVALSHDTSLDLTGKDVVLVEDIVDTGRTVSALIRHLALKNPRSLKICALLDKPSRRQVSVPIHYLGFRIADRFVVGYGLDFDQSYRNLPYIGVLPST
jgi:hypoxanthine phosphoribosyltransferase